MMNDQSKTNEQLICELQQLRQDYQSLKGLGDKAAAESQHPEVSLHEKRLALAMQGGKMAWWEMDVSTGNVTFDPMKVEMLGYAPENFKHYKDFTRLVHPDDYLQIMDAMSGHFQGVFDKYEVEYRILTNEGKYIWFHDYGSVVKMDAHGRPLICTGFVYDISARKQAEEVLAKSEQMFQTVMDNFPGVIFWKDKQSNYLGCNQAFATGAGLSHPSEIVGKSDWELPWSAAETNNYLSDDFKVMESGQAILNIAELQHQVNDRVVWLDTSKIPLRGPSGEVIGVIGVANDISRLKATEQELIQANHELTLQYEHKSKKALELTLALGKAEESDRLKSAFLANMSHEIRTPMNGILGFAELLKEPDLSVEDQQEFLSVIEKNMERMLDIISDIVEVSKIESGHINVSIEEMDVHAKMEYIYASFEPQFQAKGLQFSIKNALPSLQATIKTDKNKFAAILGYLLKNAVKFTPSGSIEMGVQKKDHCLEFFVKDTGIGVTDEQKKFIFNRFRQANESISRKYEGAGLGLSISKAYVERLGGKIWVENNADNHQNQGSVFYFTLPCNNGYTE